MSQYCQIVHVDSDSDVGTPCNNRAVAECADCGAAIRADCRTECWCFVLWSVFTHSSVREPVQNKSHVFGCKRLCQHPMERRDQIFVVAPPSAWIVTSTSAPFFNSNSWP